MKRVFDFVFRRRSGPAPVVPEPQSELAEPPQKKRALFPPTSPLSTLSPAEQRDLHKRTYVDGPREGGAIGATTEDLSTDAATEPATDDGPPEQVPGGAFAFRVPPRSAEADATPVVLFQDSSSGVDTKPKPFTRVIGSCGTTESEVKDALRKYEEDYEGCTSRQTHATLLDAAKSSVYESQRDYICCGKRFSKDEGGPCGVLLRFRKLRNSERYDIFGKEREH